MKPRELARRMLPDNQLELDLCLDPNLFWFQGHFAIKAILPGVAQLTWAMNYTTELLLPNHHFQGIQALKFKSPLLPKTTVTLVLHWRQEQQLLHFSYLRHHGEERIATTVGSLRLCP